MIKYIKILLGTAILFALSTPYAKAATTDTAKKTAAATTASGASWKGDADHGKAIFEQCKACHAIDKKGVGPALRGVNDRRPIEWIVKWVNNPEAVIKSGDEYAVKLKNEYGTIMSSFGALSAQDIKDVMQYIKDAPKPPPTNGDSKGMVKVEKDNSGFYVILALVCLLLMSLYLLNKVRNNLRRIEMEKNPEAYAAEGPHQSFWSKLVPASVKARNPVVMTLFAFAIVALIGITWFYKFSITEVGVQKGYAPEQPIRFSHKIHAGDNAIDCKYCHSTVETSKQASIPAVNTCMNCHKGIQTYETDPELGKDITKIHKAMDWDPEKKAGEQFGNNPQPIRWVRIHNLPDHAYFNHSQHVKVGKLECQECHGPVEKMEKVQQWNTLQMGWCIDCHRTKGIDVANNNYYQALHAKVKADVTANGSKSKYFDGEGKVKVTPGQNGALECSKCHY